MWKVYKYDGNYIQGELLSKHSSENAALKAAKKSIDYTFCEKKKVNKEIRIWLDGVNYAPLGVIIKNIRGWQGFDRVKKKNSASRLDTTLTVQII